MATLKGLGTGAAGAIALSYGGAVGVILCVVVVGLCLSLIAIQHN